jgi:LytS/YehU family sensor histidine kinase
LSFEIKAPPETLEAKVPNLILQPLVENAVRHGIEPHSRPGRIELVARRQGEGLALEVWDNGDGLAEGHAAERVGLSNTRARLQALYRDAHQFELVSSKRGGLSARLLIPFRTDPEKA